MDEIFFLYYVMNKFQTAAAVIVVVVLFLFAQVHFQHLTGNKDVITSIINIHIKWLS